jgi:RNA polymerase sigma factor (sigma-70 family)
VGKDAAVAEDDVIERVREAYEATHARLWQSVLAFAGSADVADEAVAEAFAQALRRGDAILDVEAWVWRAAFKIARGELALRSRDASAGEEVGRPMPESAVDLIRALQALPAADRELLVLCHFAGWTPTELAAIAGVPASTVRVRLHRATVRARHLFAKEEIA